VDGTYPWYSSGPAESVSVPEKLFPERADERGEADEGEEDPELTGKLVEPRAPGSR
jgi:hypothetical protein